MGESDRWLTLQVKDAVGFRNVHVVPIWDVLQHTHEPSCWCDPRIQWYKNGAYYAVHNSWDEREVAERMN